MAGALNILGLGSNGALTSDTLDKLKKVETDARIKPIETKIKNNDTRQSDVNTLKGMAEELRSLTRFLSSEGNYLDRDLKTSGSSVDVTIESGAKLQAFDLDVQKLASRDIYESTGFSSSDKKLSAGTLNITTANGKSFSIATDSSMSIGDLRDKIYDATDGKVSASLLKVGGDEPYKLVLKSTDTGAKNGFTIGGSTATELGFGAKTQEASDAEVNYNGITITRENNKFDDLINGVTLELKETGRTSADVTQKTSSLGDKVEKFVSKYNEFLANLQTVTSYDIETKKSGTFQGNSEMNHVIRDLKNALFENTSGSLEDIGIDVSRHGELSLNKNKLENKLKNNFDEVKSFFMGDDKGKGIFSSVNETVKHMTTSQNGTFKLLEDELKTQGKFLKKSLTSMQERVDSKFEIMQKQFAAYDAMIARMNSNFSALKAIIDSENSK